MNKNLLIVIVVVAVLVIGYVAFNSTLTGNVTKSEATVIRAGETKTIELDGRSYMISNVEVNKVSWASFIISNEEGSLNKEVSGDRNSKTIVNLGNGPIEVFIAEAQFPPTDTESRYVKIILFKK